MLLLLLLLLLACSAASATEQESSGFRVSGFRAKKQFGLTALPIVMRRRTVLQVAKLEHSDSRKLIINHRRHHSSS